MRKIVTLFAMALLLGAPALAGGRDRVRPKGQVHVSRVELFSRDGQAHLRMRVSYSTDLMNRGERLYVTPRLALGDDRMMFGSMVFDGKSRKVRVRESEVVVVADDAYGHFHFDIEYVGPCLDWMQGVSLEFHSEELLRGSVRRSYLDTLYEGMLMEDRTPPPGTAGD